MCIKSWIRVAGLSLLLVAACPSAGLAQNAPTSQPSKNLTLDLGNGASMKLVLIPAGKFIMGSPETEGGRDKNEVQHEVTISKPFYMGITHVTVDQFAAFVKDTGYHTDAEKAGYCYNFELKDGNLVVNPTLKGCSWRNPAFEQKGDHPVMQISWNDTEAFCAWLSKKTGKTVTLPTEAQWEYACRAGTTTAYPWGNNMDDGKGWANLADQSLRKVAPNKPWGFFNWDDGFAFTSPVGSYKANAFGLYDVIGNAYEWCQDRYGDYEKGPVRDPSHIEANADNPRHTIRVLRGATWFACNPRECRSASRLKIDHSDRFGDYGFRVAVVAAGVD
jgi:formylglycine-generating enzyme required for sulfatase activity